MFGSSEEQSGVTPLTGGQTSGQNGVLDRRTISGVEMVVQNLGVGHLSSFPNCL